MCLLRLRPDGHEFVPKGGDFAPRRVKVVCFVGVVGSVWTFSPGGLVESIG